MVAPTGVAVDYALNPRQFGKPIGAFCWSRPSCRGCCSEIVGMQSCYLRLAQLQDQGKVTLALVSLAKRKPCTGFVGSAPFFCPR